MSGFLFFFLGFSSVVTSSFSSSSVSLTLTAPSRGGPSSVFVSDDIYSCKIELGYIPESREGAHVQYYNLSQPEVRLATACTCSGQVGTRAWQRHSSPNRRINHACPSSSPVAPFSDSQYSSPWPNIMFMILWVCKFISHVIFTNETVNDSVAHPGDCWRIIWLDLTMYDHVHILIILILTIIHDKKKYRWCKW